MSEIQKIQVDVAAHNIATAICEKFLANQNSSDLDFDLGLEALTKEVAQIYCQAYDEAYAEIDQENPIE
ncbi:hypothetical protein [Anaerotignum lactatifermentans]|uniref:hypothetical protein n=1 Tax=Anaerotignum lactatifermentans TaxID=160404 RepID=UPI0017483A36|nr:hypothetical protein [Anaerotignum lactatifermentans]